MSTHATDRLVERFHHLAIRMLRSLRAVDEAGGLSGPRASALSLLVFRGPLALKDLAAAEGVRPPTMSRLVKSMQAEGLVAVAASGDDARRVRIEATAKGRRMMERARDRRLRHLAAAFADARPAELRALETVVELMQERFGGSRSRR
jgi:DNA-binding MarR family transcriptional regulator